MTEPQIDLEQLQKMAQVNRKVINRLKERVSILENSLTLVSEDPQMRWLYQNRSERMDPTVPMFPESRADFHLARYQFATRYVPGKSVADIACGTGYGSRLMAEGGAESVVGVDICPEAIQYANQRHQVGDRVSFETADACDTEIESGSLDLVVSFETIEHVPDDHRLLDEFARVLKPGGQLICSTPNGWPLDIAPHHVRVYDRQSFLAVLDENFETTDLFNQNSGSDFQYNHGQDAGIVTTTDENHHLAECFVAVATKKA